MAGILGSLIVGAAGGAAEADIKNTAEQNKQIMAENLERQTAEVNNYYTMATEQRHVAQGRAGMAYMGETVNSAANAYLASKGLHAPVANDPDPEHAASDDDIKTAMTIGAAKSGMLSPQVIAETASKEQVQEARASAQLESAKIIGQFRVLAERTRGSEAAAINSTTRELVAAQGDRNKTITALTNAAGNPLLSQESRSMAQAQLNLVLANQPVAVTQPGSNQPTGLLGGGPAPAAGAAPIPFDQYSPVPPAR